MSNYRRGCATFARQFFCSANFSANRHLSATNKFLYTGILNSGHRNPLEPRSRLTTPLYSQYCSTSSAGILNSPATGSSTNVETVGEDDASEMNGEATSNGIDTTAKGTFKGHPLKGTEHGFKYEKHEPTMFGDWTHMGRVTDF